jgi:hypothetical protein
MFKKLVSNLPFNPGLLQQLAFYGTRLRREKSLRKLSFGFMAATMVVNVFAVSIPAKNSLATSLNDIVYGATTKSSVLTAYKNNRDSGGRTDIRAIFNYYGITEADIAAASSVTVKSTDRNYVTTGRWESPGDDDPQSIPGARCARGLVRCASRPTLAAMTHASCCRTCLSVSTWSIAKFRPRACSSRCPPSD